MVHIDLGMVLNIHRMDKHKIKMDTQKTQRRYREYGSCARRADRMGT